MASAIDWGKTFGAKSSGTTPVAVKSAPVQAAPAKATPAKSAIDWGKTFGETTPSKPLPPSAKDIQFDTPYKTPSGTTHTYLHDGTKKVDLAPQFGGGTYFVNIADPKQIINKGHTTYAGVPSTKGSERDDIVPVSLGGDNTSKNNIRLEDLLPKGDQKPGQLTKSDQFLSGVLSEYKGGKITLGQARLKVLQYKQDQPGTPTQKPGIYSNEPKPGVLNNLTPKTVARAAGSTVLDLARGIAKPFVDVGTGVVNQARNVQSVTKALVKGQNTAQDYSNETYHIPGYGTAEPAFTGKEKPVELARKAAGTGLEIATYFMGVPEVKEAANTLKVLGAKPLSELTGQEIQSFVKAYAKKILVSSATLGITLGTGTSLKEGSNASETVKNILKSAGSVALIEAALSPIVGKAIKSGGKEGLEQTVDKEILSTSEPSVTNKSPVVEVPKNIQPALEAPATKLGIEAPKKQYVNGEGFTMTDKADPRLVKIGETKADYEAKVKSFNQNPTPYKLKLVENARAEFRAAVATPETVESTAKAKAPAKTAPLSEAGAKIDVKSPNVSPETNVNVPESKSKLATPVENPGKASGVARDIEQKAIEKNLATKFEDVAGYEPKTVADQSAKVADLVTNNLETAKKIVTGEEPLPAGMSGSMFIKGMEEHAIKNGDVALLKDLANSPLTSETSVHGQELRFLAEREQSSAVQAMKDVAAAREKSLKAPEVAKAKKAVISEIKTSIKQTVKKETWADFAESLKC